MKRLCANVTSCAALKSHTVADQTLLIVKVDGFSNF